MATAFIRLDPDKFDPGALKPAADALEKGGLVIFPTETVYGIGADAGNEEAIRRLREVKDRSENKPLGLHLADVASVQEHVDPKQISSAARRLMRRYWPGPLTLVLPAPGGGTVGVRVIRNDVGAALLSRTRCAVVGTSANLADEEPIVTEKGLDAFDGKVDVIVSAGEPRHKKSSTVVDATGLRLKVLREGVIDRRLIEEQDYIGVLFVCTGNTCRSPMAASIFSELLARQYGVPIQGVEEATGYRIQSAGTSAVLGHDMMANARSALREMGYQANPHSSQPLSRALVEESDHIYCMTSEHVEHILEYNREARERVALSDPDGADIDDPIWGDLPVYRDCARKIEEGLRKRANDIEPVTS